MNCPQCEQPVGQNQHRLGQWSDELEEAGRIIGSYRRMWIACEHCGVFTAEQDQRQFFRRITRHDSPSEIRRVLRLIRPERSGTTQPHLEAVT